MGFFDDRMPPRGESTVDDFDDDFSEHGIYLGGVVAIEEVIARSETAVVAVRGIVAYPDGFDLTLESWTRPREGERRRRRGVTHFGLLFDPDDLDEGLPADMLRFGVEFPDGSSATNLDQLPVLLGEAAGEVAPTCGMESGGGGGDDHHQDQEFWVWPVPEPGPLTLVCEWPGFDIAETRYAIDGGLIHAAAARARPVWPDSTGRSRVTVAERIRRARVRSFMMGEHIRSIEESDPS